MRGEGYHKKRCKQGRAGCFPVTSGAFLESAGCDAVRARPKSVAPLKQLGSGGELLRGEEIGERRRRLAAQPFDGVTGQGEVPAGRVGVEGREGGRKILRQAVLDHTVDERAARNGDRGD